MSALSQQSQSAGNDAITLRWLPGRFSVCRLNPKHDIPEWALRSMFISITRTDRELSIVAPETDVPDASGELRIEPGWAAMRIVGQLDFALVGILAKLTGALAEAGIPVFAISTFDTDILLVKAEHAVRAAEAVSKLAIVEPRESTASETADERR